MAKVKNKWLDEMPAKTIKGNDTSGAGDPKDLTVSEVLALLGSAPIASTVYILPVVETPSTIVREAVDGEDLAVLATLPELVYDYNSDGILDVVGEIL